MKKYFVSVIFLLLFTASAFCATYYLEADGSGDFATVQDAIDNAVDDDVIVLNPGRYQGRGNRDIDFSGKAVTVRGSDPNDWAVIEATVIDCNDAPTDANNGFILTSGEDVNSVISGLTIDGDGSLGRGVYAYDANGVYVSNCILEDFDSIAIYASLSGTITIEILGCKIRKNRGTGIFIRSSEDVTINNCQVTNNTGTDGGGIYIDGSGDVIIQDCVITANSSTRRRSGGGFILK